MTKVVVDESLRAKLNGLTEDIEMCDPAGHTLGHFVPQDLYKQMLYAWVESQCPVSEEEMERRRRENGPGRTLAEIWKRLGVQ
jgi:hypothetical protein